MYHFLAEKGMNYIAKPMGEVLEIDYSKAVKNESVGEIMYFRILGSGYFPALEAKFRPKKYYQMK